MSRKIFDLKEDQAHRVVSLFKGVCTDEGALPLDDIHRKTLTAIASHVFGTTVDVEVLDAEFSAHADSITESDLQHEIVHMAAVRRFLSRRGSNSEARP